LIKKTYILFIFLLEIFHLNASNIDSRKDSILKLISIEKNEENRIDLYNTLAPLILVNPKEIISNAERTLALSSEINYEKGFNESLHFLGIGHCENRNFDTSIICLTNALNFFLKTNNNKLVIRSYNYLGIAFENKTNYTQALWYYFKALNLSKKTNDSAYILKSLNNIGVIYLIKNEYNLAEKFLKQAYEVALLLNSERSLIDYNLAIIYLEKKEYKKALQKFEIVLIDDLKSKNKKNIAETYDNIGGCYLKLNQLLITEKYLVKALKIREEIFDENGLRNSYTNFAELYITNKQFFKAKTYLNKALLIAQKTKNKQGEVNTYDIYINYYKNQKDFKNALVYTELKDGILQEISEAESLIKLKDLETQSQLKQKATENIVEVEKQKNETMTNGLIIMLCLFVIAIIVFLSFTIYNTKKTNSLLRIKKKQLTAKNEALIKQNEQILKSQEIAKQALKAKAGFIRNISHEIRTPLNAIQGIGSILQNSKLNNEQEENVKILNTSTHKLITLVNDILDFNNLESGNGEFNQNGFKIQQLLNSLIEIHEFKIKNKGLEFIVNCEVDSNKIFKSDSLRIIQVVSNLINNAINFTENGFIKFSVKEIKRSFFKSTIRFEVIDSGKGISKENQNHIFEAFNQEDVSNTRTTQGVGLGLSICQKVIEGLGSKIMLHSEVGKGSTFAFDLNIDVIDYLSVIPHENFDKSISKIHGQKILIVEDSVVNAIILKQFFKKWGCGFDLAENGLIGLNLIKQNKYDLVLMDIQMPEMDGITCTKEIRFLTEPYFKNIPIIALTAANENTMRDAAYAAGMNDYILKPFEPEMLLEKMIRAINESLSIKT
jgi:signal transduction histidine kinase/CheY-like chemotaxis protein/Tfp pilus assembly protein PilF